MNRNQRRTIARRKKRLASAYSRASEQVELRQMLSAVSASIDGTGNNETNSDWGSTEIELLRLTTVEYADGISTPAGEDLPSARVVSNAIAAQSESTLNDRNLTDYAWIWGQFIDHDIDLSEGAVPAEEFNIEVPLGDESFDPFGTGEVEIPLTRSVYVEGDESSDGVRQQLNQITAFLDGSVVYGSDDERAAALRTFAGGLLATSEGDLLPFNVDGLENAGGTSDSLFLAGDVRANENVALTSMQTIFVREHNRLATELAGEDPTLSDEQLYQQARAIVTAELQAITYNEYLPALLGSDALGQYGGYDSTVNPGIANEFSTAAYRFGHSLLSPELQRLDADGNVIEDGNLSLSEAFFNSGEVVEQGIESVLRGAAMQLAQELDSLVIDDVRNFLFGPPGSGGLDLVSLNIQRGRDHGLADYNQVREDLGLGRVTSFDQITSNPELALALEETYGDVDSIDLWVGGLAEDHVDGSSMGETFQTIIVDQFERIRAGDSQWYQNIFDGRELRELDSTTLADVIERNTDIEGLQENIFFERGTEVLDVDAGRERSDNIAVRERNGRIEVIDRSSNRMIMSRPVDEVAVINLRGRDGTSERFTVEAAMATASAGLSVRVDGGESGGRRRGGAASDTLVVEGTRGNDSIVVDGHSISMGALDLVFVNVETLMLDGNRGDDVLDASASAAPTNILNGGAGNDVLTGGDRADRMRGGDGRDTLRGGGGDDTMDGGRGNDRLIGQDGRDQMNGGDGNDIVIQDGNGDQAQDMPPLASLLQDSLRIRDTGNNFEDWGGRGEKWLYSDAGWLFITPDGALHEWDGAAGANGPIVAELGPQIFADPTALTLAQRQRVDDDRPEVTDSATNATLENRNLRTTGNLFENWAGLGEKWLWGSDNTGQGQWYFITPDGMLYAHDPAADGVPGNFVAELSSDVFNNPERTTRRR